MYVWYRKSKPCSGSISYRQILNLIDEGQCSRPLHFFFYFSSHLLQQAGVLCICSKIHSTGLLFCVITADRGLRGQKFWYMVWFHLIRKALLLSTMRTMGVWQRAKLAAVLWMWRTQTSIERINDKKITCLACSVFKSRSHAHVHASSL